ncbi:MULTISPECIES: cell division protein ZapA [unclassified Sphingomonas]|uniref:cell division protein ZapA n=1 Tax=unclassified Sphingomonas TaxID=196159 RepID=UPI000BDB216D|nr:MAG: cell division protein ZapA [Sphingomonas sp. 32-62-10]OYY64132.1 MAG: cell division protein ZapA [Sphingomonas sp. 28-62-11]
MAEVVLSIGDRQHRIPCRDGSEDQFRRIATKLDSRWAAAERASGGMNAERSMLYVALMLADALDEAERRVAPSDPAQMATPSADLPDLERLADRLEAIAAALEKPPESA